MTFHTAVPNKDAAMFLENFGAEIKVVDGQLVAKIYTGTVCKHLIMKDGKSSCGIYDERPSACRNYPVDGQETKKGCGYKWQ